MTPPTWVPEDADPHANAYFMAYKEAANLTDAQLVTARTDVARSIKQALHRLASARGRDAGLAQAQRERRIAEEKGEDAFTGETVCTCETCIPGGDSTGRDWENPW